MRERETDLQCEACLFLNVFGAALPSGVYSRTIRKHLNRYRFSNTKIPFACTSTAIGSAELLVQNEGSIYEALRVSMAILGLFKPKKKGGKAIADVGILNNLPVSVAKEASGTFVVPVDLSSMRGASSFSTSNSILRNIDEYRANVTLRELALADVVISPLMKRNIDSLGFSSCIDAVNESYERALGCDLNGVTL